MKDRLCILNTGAPDAVLQQIAMQEGVDLQTIPFIQVMSVVDETSVQEQLQPLYGRELPVVFTSAQAVRGVCGQAGFKEHGWRIYCVGHATRAAVLEYIDERCVAGTAANAAALADTIIDAGERGRVVFFCSDKRLDTLPDKLAGAGINVHEVVVYETRETPVFAGGSYDGILFFSPSAVNSFFSMNIADEGVVMFAIGETTAEMLRQQTPNKVLVSDVPVKEQVLRQAIAHLKQLENS